MAAGTVMIIRHGEKPVKDSYTGIDLNGTADPNSLIPQGWMRCGALGRFFVPLHAPSPSTLVQSPQYLFASAATSGVLRCAEKFNLPSNETVPGQPPPILGASNSSLREQEVLLCVSALTQVSINATYRAGMDEQALAAEVAQLTPHGNILIAWEHDHIPLLANAINQAIGPAPQAIPQTWDGNRFDLVWVFYSNGAAYNFQQVAQMLLPGDAPVQQ
jgi:hypothetical protein